MPKDRYSKPGLNDNWKVVVLAIVGAATFWFFNALNKNYDTRVNYPLEFEFDKDSVVVVAPLADEVHVDVNGGGWNLLRKTFWLNSSPIRIELEKPTEVKFFTQSTLVPIISDQLGGLRLNYVVTDTIFINIEEKVSKKVRVAIDSMAVPVEDGFRVVSRITLSPDSLVLTGPKSLMANLRPVVWGKFEQDGIDGNFDANIPVDLPGNGLIASNFNEIHVGFEVDKFVRHSMAVEIEPLNFASNPAAYLMDSVVNINFMVSERNTANMKASDFGVTADYSMRSRSDSTIIPVLLYFPDGISDIQIVPGKVKIRYSQN